MILVMMALLTVVTEMVTGKNAFKSVSVKSRKDCKTIQIVMAMVMAGVVLAVFV